MFFASGNGEPSIKNSLKTLAFPSTVDFTHILQDILNFFEGTHAEEATGLTFFKKYFLFTHKDLNRTRELFTTLGDYLGLKKSETNTFNVIELFELFSIYKASIRDKELTGEDFYLLHGSLLFHSCNEILDAIDFFEDQKLILLEEVSTVKEGLSLTFRELKAGVHSNITEVVAADRVFQSGKVYLKLSDGTFLSLYPCLIYKEDDFGENIYFLDRDDMAKSTRFLSFSSGKWTSDPDDLVALRELLTSAVGQEVDSDLHAALIEEVINQEKEFLTPRITGKLLGDFEILEKIGEGGMGTVFKARQLSLDRTVAIKTLPMELSKHDLLKARFRLEITVLGKCDHPNIVKVIASGEEEGSIYYAMEYVEGVSLSDIFHELSGSGTKEPLSESTLIKSIASSLQKKRRDQVKKDKEVEPSISHSSDKDYYNKIARYGIDAAIALKYIHEKNIIHRDVKPSNFMVTEDGDRLVLMDFGLARYEGTQTLTTASVDKMLGTIRYASPQQIAGIRQKIDHRTDIYSLAATLYEMVSLNPLFDAESQPELMNKVLVEEPIPLKIVNPEAPDDLATIILKGLEKDPENRYATAEDMAEDLGRFIRGEPIFAKSPGTWQQVKHLVKRHKGAVSAALIIFFLTFLGGSTSFVFWQKSEVALKNEKKSRNMLKEALKTSEGHLNISKRNLALAWKEKSRLLMENHDYRGAHLASAAAIASDKETAGKEAFSRLLRSRNLYRNFRPLWTAGVDRKKELHNKPVHIPVEAKPLNVISPDGKNLISLSRNGTATIWDLASGKETTTFMPEFKHEDEKKALEVQKKVVSLSPDGKYILGNIIIKNQTGDKSVFKSAKLWNLLTQKEIKLFKGNEVKGSAIFSNNGRLLAYGLKDNTIRIWDCVNGKLVKVLKGHENLVRIISFADTPDVKRLISKGGEGTYWVWDLITGKVVVVLKTDKKWRYDFNFSPDGRKIAVRKMKRGRRNKNHGDTSVTLNDFNSLILKGENIGSWLLDAITGNILKTFKVDKGYRHALVFSADGKKIAIGKTRDRMIGPKALRIRRGETYTFIKDLQDIYLWDIRSGKPLYNLKEDKNEIYKIIFSPDGKILASIEKGNNIRLRDARSGKTLHVLKGPAKLIYKIDFSPDGNFLASVENGNIVRLWDVNRGKMAHEIRDLPKTIHSLDFLPNANKIAIFDGGSVNQIWNVNTRKIESLLLGKQKRINDLAFSPDKSLLASAGRDKIIRIRDIATGKVMKEIEADNFWVESIAFSRDGKKLTSVGKDGTIKIWSVGTFEALQTSKKNAFGFNMNNKLVLSPDGDSLVTTGREKGLSDGTVKEFITTRLWDIPSGENIVISKGKTLSDSLFFSSDGTDLFMVKEDGDIEHWKVKTGTYEGKIEGIKKEKGLHGNLVALSPNKGILAYKDFKNITLWDLEKDQLLSVFKLPEGSQDLSAISFSPIGLLLAVGTRNPSKGNMITIWELASKKKIVTLNGFQGTITSITFSDDGKILAAADEKGTMRVWKIDTDTWEGTFSSARFSPENKTLALGGANGSIYFYQIGDGKVQNILEGHSGYIGETDFSSSGKYLASYSIGTDNSVRIWDAVHGEALKIVRGRMEMKAITLLPHEKKLASLDKFGTIRFWDISLNNQAPLLKSQKGSLNWKELSKIEKDVFLVKVDGRASIKQLPYGNEIEVPKGYEKEMRSGIFSPEKDKFAMTTFDRNNGSVVRIFDVSTGEQLLFLEPREGSNIYELAFSPDGKLLASVGSEIRIWDVKTGKELKAIYVKEGVGLFQYSISFSADGKLLASSGDDHIIRIWGVKSGSNLARLQGHIREVTVVKFSPNGTLLASSGHDKTVRLWDVQTGESKVLKGHNETVYSLAFSPDGSFLASGDKTNVRLWDIRRLKLIKTIEIGDAATLEFSSDGKVLASRNFDGTISINEINTGKTRMIFNEEITHAKISPNENILAFASASGQINLWKATAPYEIKNIKGHEGLVLSINFSPDGKYLASSGKDNTVRIWDVESGKELKVLKGHGNSVTKAVFSPDGKLLVSGGKDKKIRLFDLATGNEITVLDGHDGIVHSVAFSPDGRHIISSGEDMAVRIWDVESGKEYAILNGHESKVTHIALSQNGEFLVSSGFDGVRLWRLNLLFKDTSFILQDAERFTDLRVKDFSIVPIKHTPSS